MSRLQLVQAVNDDKTTRIEGEVGKGNKCYNRNSYIQGGSRGGGRSLERRMKRRRKFRDFKILQIRGRGSG